MTQNLIVRRRVSRLAVAALMIAGISLSGCAGGGTASTPAPTPAPTPTPTTAAVVPVPLSLQTGTTQPEALFFISQSGTQASHTSATSQTNSTSTLSTGSNITYNSGTNVYTINDGLGGLGSQQFTPGNVVTNANDYITFDNRLSGTGATLKMLTPGTANPVIALTYTSFALLQTYKPATSPAFATGLANSTYFVFGQQTPMAGVPTTGSASYSGVMTGVFANAADNYNLSGTATLNANFLAKTLTTSMAISGVGINNGQTLALGTFSGSSSITALNGSASFAGTLANAGNALITGLFGGNFYGPAATEFGYSFSLKEVNAANATISVGGGVAVGH